MPAVALVVPNEKPVESNEVKEVPAVSNTAASVLFEDKTFLTPLTESNNAWLVALLLDLIHTKSGWKFVPLTVLAIAKVAFVPVYNVAAVCVAPLGIVGVDRL